MKVGGVVLGRGLERKGFSGDVRVKRGGVKRKGFTRVEARGGGGGDAGVELLYLELSLLILRLRAVSDEIADIDEELS